jgi:hypothetical protein
MHAVGQVLTQAAGIKSMEVTDTANKRKLWLLNREIIRLLPMSLGWSPTCKATFFLPEGIFQYKLLRTNAATGMKCSPVVCCEPLSNHQDGHLRESRMNFVVMGHF